MSESAILQQLYRIKTDLEKESDQESCLRFQTPYNYPILKTVNGYTVASLKAKVGITNPARSDNSLGDSGITNPVISDNSLGYRPEAKRENPLLQQEITLPENIYRPDILTHQLIALTSYDEELKLDSLLRVKKHVPAGKLAYFDLKNCFYNINPNMLPDNLRNMSLNPFSVLLNEGSGEYYVINPKRGLVACDTTAAWFSDMVIAENPYIAACFVDDCFCSVDYLDEAKRWFTDRGFEINNNKLSCNRQLWIVVNNKIKHYNSYRTFTVHDDLPELRKRRIMNAYYLDDNVIKNSTEIFIDCNICCGTSGKHISKIACVNCFICYQCFYDINKYLPYCNSCKTCGSYINLTDVLLTLQPKFHLESAELVNKIVNQINGNDDPSKQSQLLERLDSMMKCIVYEVDRKFPGYKNITCWGCKSLNVTSIDDLCVYRCNDCSKVYCNTCDLDTLPVDQHKCTMGLLRCPKCNVFIYKDGGCNDVTCSGCGENFYYGANKFVGNLKIDIGSASRLDNIKSNDTLQELMFRVAQMDIKSFQSNYINITRLLMKGISSDPFPSHLI